MANDETISKTLSYWLRHAPQDAALVLDSQGWAATDLVLAELARRFEGVDFQRLLAVAEGNDKQRFEFSVDLDRIRARQGHSAAVDMGLAPTTPPDLLYHGTVQRFLPAILLQGLKPMGRQHVHLSRDPETARKVGARRGPPVILQVAAAAMAASGHAFMVAGNGVWLTAAVPPAFLKRLR
jgi:putative RNA 2'-phosphotransferase